MHEISKHHLLYETYCHIYKLKQSVRKIESYVFRKTVMRARLLKKCDVDKMIMVQKWMRGWFCRLKNQSKIK